MFIPDDYFFDKRLTSNDKVLLAFIYSFNNTELLSTKFIAKELNLSSPTVLKCVRLLNSLGYIALYGDKIEKLEEVERVFKSK